MKPSRAIFGTEREGRRGSIRPLKRHYSRIKPGICIIIGLVVMALRGFAQDGTSNIEFVENKGQWDPQVHFKGDLPNGALFLEKTGFRVLLYNSDDLKAMTAAHHGASHGGVMAGTGVYRGGPGVSGGGPAGGAGKKSMLRAHAYDVAFADANPDVEIVPDKALPGYNNYLIGPDTTKWGRDCKVFQGVTYRNLYPNIDVRYYTNNGQLKYDIIVHPGGDVGRIKMLYTGADKLSTHKGQLLVGTSVGQITQLAPVSYLSGQQGRTDIRCRYTIHNGNTVSFDVPEYDAGSTLIIDPVIIFCTFTGSRISNWGFTATPGTDGSFFAGGIVFGSAFPYNTGAVQPIYGGGKFDVGLIKLSSNGSTKVYATYLGGDDSETPHSLICDGSNEVIVLGRTYSGASFTHSTLIGPGGGADMFVVKLNAAGNGIVGAVRIGGSMDDCVNMEDQARVAYERADSLIRNYGDDSRSEVVLDAAGNILIGASSQSTDFPVRGNVFQPVYGGGHQDGVVLELNPGCNNLLWASYLGGSGADACFVLNQDPMTGDIYIGGATTSGDFPGNKAGVIQPSYAGGGCDGYVAQISGDGSVLKRSTYLGTNVSDAVYGLKFDRKGFPYVMGTTNGTWPVQNAAYSVGGGRQFISKLKPDLSAFVYSTVFGTPSGASHGLPNISPVAFLVDRCENVYVSGWGGWIIGGESDPYGLLGTAGMPTTPDATKPVSDNRDFYFIVIKKNASGLLYGTFFGENDNSRSISEHVDGGTSRYDQQGVIYQAICANCSGPAATGRYPTTPGSWSPNNGAANIGCNEVAVKIAFNFAGVAAGLRASVNGRLWDTAGCIPMDTQLQDTIRNAKSYIWNFGDGSPDTATTTYIVNHTYPNPGVYTVMMVAIDSNTCNVADTAYRHVIARTDRAQVDFAFVKDPAAPCTSLDYDFTNTSVAPAGKPFGPTSFTWDFGDNTGQIVDGAGPLNHSFASPGAYVINLIMDDTSYCNYPDTASHTLRVSPLAKAQFVTPSTGCAPYGAVFNNTSLGGVDFTWDFGDPASGAANTSTDVNPVHVYQNPGTYTINLHEVDPSTCNQVSDTSFTITVSVKPTAAFTFAPSPPVANIPIVFTNGSEGGVSYKWLFGDGDSIVTNSMDTVQYLYNTTDTFPVCLLTTNQYGCTDTVCHPVATLINPLLDVPNAFTPGRFGTNSILKVVGFGILRMDFRIYNRWGKMIFESENPNVGWDGNYLGAPQPMDVYAYTLEAEFSNGAHITKKGDITLVR